MRISRLVVVAALIGAFCMAATASASADTTSCTVEKASVKLSPGLTNTPAIQNVQIKGTLSGCTGEESAEVTGGSIQIHAKTTEAVSCSALTTGAATTGDSIALKWKPKPATGSSAGTGSVSLIEGAGALSGLVESGTFNEDVIGGSLTQTYTGGATCGVPTKTGKPGHEKEKAAKKVNKGTASGTLTITE